MLRISDAPGGEGVFACPTCTHVGFHMLRISDASVSCWHVASEMRRMQSPTQGVGCMSCDRGKYARRRCAGGEGVFSHAPRARTWGFTCYASPMRFRAVGCPARLRRAWLRGDLRMPHVHARGVSRVTHLRCASGRSGCPARLRRAWLRGGIFACPTCTHVGFRMLRISDALPCGRVSCASPMRLVERGSSYAPRARTWGFACYASPMRCRVVGFQMLRISDAFPMRGGSETRGM